VARVSFDKSQAAARPEQHYSNHLEVGFNSVEFLLRFGQAHEGHETSVSELVTTPTFARAFSVTLAEALSRYEARFGPIPEVKS
jgi:Protein of unknown function (DUF3467)